MNKAIGVTLVGIPSCIKKKKKKKMGLIYVYIALSFFNTFFIIFLLIS